MRKLIFLPLIFFTVNVFSQSNMDVFVDSTGVMRWKSIGEEVSLFGVNYTTPFAYAYRAHQRLSLSHKKAIDLDVAQMKRLGFDAFRVHVWDTEISDSTGNLLKNDHLDLFDYLLAKLSENRIKTIITPIAWWGNGWPEPNEHAPGFSQNYQRLELITNSKAREAQRRYLTQFMTHTNLYSSVSYNNDPSIIAVEIINEPSHPESGQEVTDYINDMAGVLRSAGFTKPIFYNISQNWSDVQANAVTQANVDGISFQWYPTDLVHHKMLKGNYLPNVNVYVIPSETVAGYAAKAKMVYEFDAADVGGSYLYPAVVRSFRESGMQFAAMFSYDPTQIAWSNTEYPTHFINLLYTPSKALSLMIAGRAFHQLPRNKSYGSYPANNQFGDYRVCYEEDLSEMNSESEFIHSNTTKSTPRNIVTLLHIAGCGTSVLIQYDGTGAYFLDKLETGIWSLEIYPDVLWLRDPFESASLSQQAARLFWNKRKMKIDLPDLGNEYVLYPLSHMKKKSKRSIGPDQLLSPGKYLVMKKNIESKNLQIYLSKKEKFLEGLYTPPPIAPHIYIVNNTAAYSNELNPSVFQFQIAGERSIVHPSLYIRRPGWRGFSKHPLKCIGGFEYVVADTPGILQSGNLEYCVAVEAGGKDYTFPGGVQTTPGKWDFTGTYFWSLKILDADESVVLLNVSRDRKDFVFPNYDPSRKCSIDYKNGASSEEKSLKLDVSFSQEATVPFGFQLDVSEYVRPFAEHLEKYRTIAVRARSNQDSLCSIGFNLLMTDGKSYGVNVQLKKSWDELQIPLAAFRAASSLLLPNSYPLFLPRIRHTNIDSASAMPDLCSLERIQLVVNPPELMKQKSERESSFEIESIVLKK